MCLNNISAIQPPVLSVLTQLVTVVLDGLRANKTFITLQGDEIPLASHGVCFATLNCCSHESGSEFNPSVGFFPSFKSSASFLPKELLELFRPVALVGPDLQIILEAWLLSQGFTQVSSLASKIVTLRDLCQKLLPRSSKPLPGDLCSCLHKCTGWGVRCLKRVIEDAGSQLSTDSGELQATRASASKPLDDKGADDRAVSPTDAVVAVNTLTEAPGQHGTCF